MKSFLPTLSAISIALISTNLMAQESVQLDTITVKEKLAQTTGYIPVYTTVGTKTVTSLARTPFSINVVSEKLMLDQAAPTVTDSLAYTTGAVGGYRGENTLIEMSIRGISNKSDGGTIPTYLNGSRYQTAYEIDPFFLESINVLKGPNSILYGQANPGGIVDIITKKAKGENHRQLQFTLGNHQRYQLGIDVEHAFNESLSARLVSQLEKTKWQSDYVKEQGGAISPSILWKPNENTELNLFAYYAKRPKAGDRNFLTYEGTIQPVDGQTVPYDFFASDPNYHHLSMEQLQIGYDFTHKLTENLKLHQIVSYHTGKDDLKNLIVWDSKGSVLTRKARTFETKTQEWNADTQLQYNFNILNTAHTLLAGIDYKRVKEDGNGYLGNAPSIDWRNPVYGVNVSEPTIQFDELKSLKQLGGYLQDQMAWRNVDFLVGVRYDHAKTSNYNRLNDSLKQVQNHELTWRTGAIYNFENGIAPYISYSTSFVPSMEQDSAGNTLKPTTANQWEVGIKYQPNQDLLFTLAGFKITQHDLANYKWQTHSYEQLGKVETKGVEVSLNQQISDKFAITASYAYLNKAIKADANSANIGKTQWGTPRHQASVWAKYQLFNPLSIAAGVRYMGSTFGDDANTYKVPRYTLYDMAIGYDINKATHIQLNAQNLTTKKYVASCANKFSCFYGAERRLTATLTYQF